MAADSTLMSPAQYRLSKVYRDGGEDVLEAKRCNLNGAVQQQGDEWPDGSIPWRPSPLLNHERSNGYDCDLHSSRWYILVLCFCAGQRLEGCLHFI